MKTSAAVSELIVRWEESRRAGKPVTPEQLCDGCPERIGEVKQWIAALESIGGLTTVKGADLPSQPNYEADLNRPRYQRIHPHAAGGLGEVWRGHDIELGRPVALKRMQDGLDGSADALRRFIREAEITSRLQHPGIVPVYGLIQEGGGPPIYAMRFIEGRSLNEAINQLHRAGSTLDLRPLLQRFVSVCNTLAYAHRQGVIHRDLKPANIMLGDYGETLVVDWGVARVVDSPAPEINEANNVDDGQARRNADEASTRAGSLLGTPAYMSPEQATAQSVGPPADIFGLGATLFHLLTNRPPYEAATTGEVIQQARTGAPPSARGIRRDTPRPLDAICCKAMSPRPEDRYASALELANDIERWLAGAPVSVDVEPWHERCLRWARRHRLMVATAAAAVLVSTIALAIGAVLMHRQQMVTMAQRDRADANADLSRQALDEFVMAVVDHPRLVHADFFDVRQELLTKAVPFCEQLVKQQEGDPSFKWRHGNSHYRLALIRAEIGENEPALTDLSRAREILSALDEPAPGRSHLASSVGMIEMARGVIMNRLGRTAEAEGAFRKAIDELSSLGANANVQVGLAQARMNYGNLLKDSGRLPEAETLLKQARDEFASAAALNPKDAKLRSDWAKAEHDLGFLYSDMGRLDDSTAAYDRAVSQREQLIADHPTVPSYRHDLAQTLSSQGNVLLALQRFSEAERKHRAAIDAFQDLAATFPKMPKYRRDLATAWNNLGISLDHQRCDDDAEQAFRTAIDWEERLTNSHAQVPAYRQGLARSLSNLAVLRATRGHRGEADELYCRVIGIYSRLAADHPGVAAYRLDHARTVLNRGYLASDDGRPNDAVRLFSEAIVSLKTLHNESPELAAGRAQLRNALGGRALAHDAGNQLAAAIEDWNAALHHSTAEDRGEIIVYRARTLVKSGQIAKAVADVSALDAAKQLTTSLLVDAAKIYGAAAVADAARTSEFAGQAKQFLLRATRAGQIKDRAALNALLQSAEFAPIRDDPDVKVLANELPMRKAP